MELSALEPDGKTSREEPETTVQTEAENRAALEFNPNLRFYLAFSTLAVVTLAV
jgi:hypothetical protein